MGSFLPAQFFKNVAANEPTISNRTASGVESPQLSPMSRTEVERRFMSMLEEHDRVRTRVLSVHTKPDVINY